MLPFAFFSLATSCKSSLMAWPNLLFMLTQCALRSSLRWLRTSPVSKPRGYTTSCVNCATKWKLRTSPNPLTLTAASSMMTVWILIQHLLFITVITWSSTHLKRCYTTWLSNLNTLTDPSSPIWILLISVSSSAVTRYDIHPTIQHLNYFKMKVLYLCGSMVFASWELRESSKDLFWHYIVVSMRWT